MKNTTPNRGLGVLGEGWGAGDDSQDPSINGVGDEEATVKRWRSHQE
jgi:hypothetical protein